MPKASATSEVKSKFAIGDLVLIDMTGDGQFTVPAEIIELNPKDDKGKKIGDYKVTVTEGEDAGVNYDCATAELQAKPAKKAGTKVKPEPEPEPEEAEPEEQPAKPANKKAVKASGPGWNDVKPAPEVTGGFPLGNHEALIYSGECVEQEDGRIRVTLDFVGVNDKKVEGVTQKLFCAVRNEKGEWNQQGLEYLKRDLFKIGFTEEDLAIDDDTLVEDLNTLLKKLKKRTPWVAIRVVQQRNNTQYTQLYIQTLMDDQGSKPEIPELAV